MRFIATTKLGLESVTAFQLKKMNMSDVQNADANVSFTGSYEDMARALLYLRTAERLLLEEQSTSTAENLMYSMRVLENAGLDTTGIVAIVTNDFHLFRAQLIARDVGMAAIGIPAELPWWWLNANYYVRDFFALGKLLLGV